MNASCQFGDRIADCPPDMPWRCYDNTYRHDCCYTCGGLYVPIKGCEYGNKVGGCMPSECNTYSNARRQDCCESCPPLTTPNTTVPPGSTSTAAAGPITPSPSTDSPDLVALIAGSIGGLLLITLLIVVLMWWRRRKQAPHNLSPIDEKMYNDYKVSKRPPMALPRDHTLPGDRQKINKESLMRQDSAEYAYINPDQVTRQVSGELPSRSENDSLPVPPSGPIEYLQLGDADRYGYIEAIADGHIDTHFDAPIAGDSWIIVTEEEIARNEQFGLLS